MQRFTEYTSCAGSTISETYFPGNLISIFVNALKIKERYTELSDSSLQIKKSA